MAMQVATGGGRRTSGGNKRRGPRKGRKKANNPLNCEVCGKRFPTEAGARSHANAVHNLVNAGGEDRLRYPALRSGAMSNVLTNQIRAVADMKGIRLSMTTAGYKWAMRAMHPMDETSGGGIAIPDDTVDQSAIMELRHSGILGMPTRYGTANTWDCQVLSPPLPDMPIVYRTKPGGSAASEWSRWIQFSPAVGAQQTGRFLIGWATETTAENPGWIKAPTMLENSTQFRQSFRGVTIEVNTSSFADEGFFTGGQWGSKPRLFRTKPFDSSYGDSGQITIADELTMLVFPDIPDTPDALVAKVAGCERWAARQGAYFPLWFNDPAHQFTAGEGESWTDNREGTVPRTAGVVGCPVILSPAVAPDVQDFDWIADMVFLSGEHDTDGFTAMTTAGSVNQHMGCGFFMGLDKTASLMFTARSGEELDPDSESPIAPFAVRSPLADDAAIKAVQAIQRQMQMVYPAKFNSLGMLAPLIAKAARMILPIALPWLNQKLIASVQGGVPSI